MDRGSAPFCGSLTTWQGEAHMSAKAYDKKTAAFAGFVIQNIPADLTDQEMDGWMDNPDATKKFLSGLKSSTAKPLIAILVKTTSIGDIEGEKTGKCLTGKRWAYRDGDIDRWLPAVQSAQENRLARVYQLQNRPGTSLDLLAKALKEQGLTFALQAIEQLVDRQEDGEDVGLRTDGYANFFFVEDSDGSISVLLVYRYVGGWCASVYRLDVGDRWGAEDRPLLRN